jgi:YHS domain-containing protein
MVFDTGPFRGVGQASATVVDPECGMSVDPATAAAQRRYGQREYYFCSETCAEAFDANPKHHLARLQACMAGVAIAVTSARHLHRR